MDMIQATFRSTSVSLALALTVAIGWCGLVLLALSAIAGADQSGQRTSWLPLGLVDVTVQPFRADPTGQADATAAIRQAVEEARRRKAAVFFPPGVYQVSDTLEYGFHRAAGRKGQDSPCVLIGSREGPSRPRLRLAPNSPGYGIDAGDCRATAPTVSGVTLIGQKISALRYNGLETLSLVGARIVVPAGRSAMINQQ